ncbi:tyrosine-type recombinase/integrase [Stutzerimonas kunmingensis]|uniref:tyrosine-type recombinase/integrase n=1 Tax=Stutzerimonas kunmingensis TaxID=1211807 RepID=UPI0028967C03|nr:tyrosine-type recombinase/integrase [Stutzerimonas kunmingensis]
MGHKLTDAQAKSWAATGTIKKSGVLTPTRTFSEQLGARGAGSMLLERRPNGGIEVYLAVRRGGRQERRKLGHFGELSSGGQNKGLSFWRLEAERVSAAARDFPTLGAYESHLLQLSADQRRDESLATRQGSLEQLLMAYVADMERRGKTSAKGVLGALRLDVIKAFPALAETKAKDIQPEDVSEILRHCISRKPASKGRGIRKTEASTTNGKLTAANRLRAYLRAAFSFGLKHDLNPLRAGDAVLFGLRFNPVADLPTIEGAERANTEALTKDEFREVIRAVNSQEGKRQAIARAMIYLAGQRVEMLMRATWADLLEDAEHGRVLRLLDNKGGKGTPPRDHLLPISGRLGDVLQPLLELQHAPGPFSLDGLRRISSHTAQKIFSELGAELSKRGRTRYFTWRTMRVTIETHLAMLGVDEQRRAWLLSHGRSGVQAKHYDRYSYLKEKREDLARWAAYLDALV